eukprot:TRINITY_DN1578_c0_g1_i2.p1 TRINITY_DN1578_c0_g1~~TRINITY_DN1578_c0_g1_i2.p1  ORF type:complete len:543 (-),score=114.50 TRINITY_DN1578_c0_g1_i2:348-1892(-)
MEAPAQKLTFVERNAFSWPVFSDDDELKCLGEDSDFFEDVILVEKKVVRLSVRSLAFAARKERAEKQKPEQKSIKAPEDSHPLPVPMPKTSGELRSSSSPSSASVTKSERPSWADLRDDSSKEELRSSSSPWGASVTKSERPSWADLHDNSSEEEVETNGFGEHMEGYSTDQSADACMAAKSATGSAMRKETAPLRYKGSLARQSPMTTQQAAAVEAPLLVWDTIGISKEKVELPSEHLSSTLMEGWASGERTSATNFDKWSWSTTASSAAQDFEGLLEEMPPPLMLKEPPIAKMGARQQTLIASQQGKQPAKASQRQPAPVSASHRQPDAATKTSPCLGFGIIPVMVAFPVIPMPHLAAQTTGMWWNCEAPQKKQAHYWEAAAGEQRSQQQQHQHQQQQQQQQQQSQPGLSATGLAGSLAMRGPCFGSLHRFHHSMASMGVLSADLRSFTKTKNANRLSIACEDRVHSHGIARYAVQFTSGELSNADGVGFILSNDVPCTKNIQRMLRGFKPE